VVRARFPKLKVRRAGLIEFRDVNPVWVVPVKVPVSTAPHMVEVATHGMPVPFMACTAPLKFNVWANEAPVMAALIDRIRMYFMLIGSGFRLMDG